METAWENPIARCSDGSAEYMICRHSQRVQPRSLPIDPSSLQSLIRQRRSIKPSQFLERRIPDEIVEELLDNANWAPTHGMTEPWRFFVFCDDGRERVSRQLAEIYRTITPVETQKPGKADKLMDSCRRSSHVIVIGLHRQRSEKIPELEEIEAVACAVQNLHLTATAHGLGGYWSSGKAICSKQFRDFVGLQAPDRVLGLFYLGYPSGDWPDGTRTPAANKVQWHDS